MNFVIDRMCIGLNSPCGYDVFINGTVTVLGKCCNFVIGSARLYLPTVNRMKNLDVGFIQFTYKLPVEWKNLDVGFIEFTYQLSVE